MKHVQKSRFFQAGEVLDPNHLNSVWKYKQDLVSDTAEQRYVESVINLNFVKDAFNGYSNSDSAFLRSFIFTPPEDIYVTRSFLYSQMASGGTGVAQVFIQTYPGGVTVSGATAPHLEVDASVTSEQRDYNPARFKLTGGQAYRVYLAGTGTFTTERFEVQLHVLSDVYGFGAAPEFTPALVTEASPLSESVQDLNEFNYTTAASNLTGSSQAVAPVCSAYHSVTVDTASNDEVRHFLPSMQSTRVSSGYIAYVSAQVQFASNQTGTMYIEIKNSAGTLVASVSKAFGGTEWYWAGSVTVNIRNPTTGAPADSSLDFSIGLGNNFGSVTADKVFLTAWLV